LIDQNRHWQNGLSRFGLSRVHVAAVKMPEYRRRKTVGARPNGSCGASFSALCPVGAFPSENNAITKTAGQLLATAQGEQVFKRAPLALSRDEQIGAMPVN